MLENTLFETHFNIIPFPIYVVDAKAYEILFCNNHFKTTFGEHTGNTCYQSLYQRDEPCIHCKIPEIVDDDGKPNGLSLTFEHFNDVDDHWYQLQEKALSWPDGRTVKHSIAIDITELKQTQNKLVEAHAQLALKNRELEVLSSTDKLTGLSNRMKVEDELGRELHRARRYGSTLSVIMLDIDHFKRVNDQLGHQAGDKVLQDVARAVGEDIRAEDLVGRWGGEEFLIICPLTDLEGASATAEKLRKHLEELRPGAGLSATGSFGVVQLVPDEDAIELLRRVDKALYASKAAGRNTVTAL